MPRTTIPVTTPISPYPALPLTADSADVAYTAADVANGNQATFGNAGKVHLLATNTGGVGYTATVTSSLDGFNRTGDITAYALAAGETALFPLERNGWRQSDGMLYFSASNAAVKFAVIPVT